MTAESKPVDFEWQFLTHADRREARSLGLLKGGDIYIDPDGHRTKALHLDGMKDEFFPRVLEQRPELTPPRKVYASTANRLDPPVR